MIILLTILYVIQLIVVVAVILHDVGESADEFGNKIIDSKKTLLNCLIPFIWVIAVLVSVVRWYKSLK